MRGRPPDDDATIRVSPREAAARIAAPPSGGGGRRWLLAGVAGFTVLTALGAGAVFLLDEGPPPPQRLGPRMLVPPLLRARVGASDVLFMLARRAEQDATDPPDAPAPRDRIELVALDAGTLAPRFEVHLASVPRGALGDAALIAEQGATVWIWLGGLGAVSAVDGRVLADQDGLAERNPQVVFANLRARGALRTADALVIEGPTLGGPWRLDPRDFAASLANQPPPRPLPPLHAPAQAGQGGPTAFRLNEARIGPAWFGLPAETEKLAGPMAPRGRGFIAPAVSPPGAPQALWRGAVRMASAAPPNWPANMPNRFGEAERLVDLAAVPGATGLHLAGFLTAGTPDPLRPAPDALLLLHGAPGQPLGLMRIGADGRIAWRAALPVGAVRSVLPGAAHLLLADWRGTVATAGARIVSVALDDGAVAELALSA
ncbi:hypothetical protein J5Y09_11490 [Roseomonas sp. PWR1]|uniref:DUF4115 domain-containing protein n=1 Tax=Roseomonas nitratireducens TaxID=2820810 RepID=A0ABS4AT35_9PROT|nr:hypothetical protein [Neoroseomonas nitratireducens]MBP0464530.1 hypothetical protein [Neoroseomonas nitratireducens]